jgi:hypothetical protein
MWEVWVGLGIVLTAIIGELAYWFVVSDKAAEEEPYAMKIMPFLFAAIPSMIITMIIKTFPQIVTFIITNLYYFEVMIALVIAGVILIYVNVKVRLRVIKKKRTKKRGY